MYYLLLPFALLSYVACDASVKFNLPALPTNYVGNKRCLIYNFGENELVTGFVNSQRVAGGYSNFRTNAWIEDNIGNKHWQKYDVTGEVRFAFKTQSTALTYQCCVLNELLDGSLYKNPPSSDVEVLAESNIDLFDESMAHEKVEPLRKNIINIEPVLRHIVTQLDELYNTEKIMRDTNEATNDRVRWLSVLSIITLVLLGLFQMFYLKRYFKSKKLI